MQKVQIKSDKKKKKQKKNIPRGEIEEIGIQCAVIKWGKKK